MRATRFEYRFRVAIIAALYLIGFLAPWERYLPSLAGLHVWSGLALELFRTGWLTTHQAFLLVLAAAVACAIAAALLRLWATASLGQAMMRGSVMQVPAIVVSGPYRYVRNPLDLGTWLTAAAVSILMPGTGGLVFLLTLAVFQLRLIGGEEAYLTARQGDAYLAYRAKVGSILPRIGSGMPRPGPKPRWLQALAAEVYPIGVAFSFAALGWTYDTALLTRAVIICFGGSLVVNAFQLPPREKPDGEV